MTAPLAEYGAFGVVCALVFGLLVGSFLNVLIHRLPRGESIVSPGSHCPACGAPIRARDNVPVLSWIFLGGRCRACRAPIAVRYPAVELVNGVLWALVFVRGRDWPEVASGFFLVSACLALLAIDAEFQILPDWITLTGIAMGLGISFLPGGRTPVSSLLGIALGGGGLWAIAFLYERIAGQEGMGLGDVKMLAMIGAFLGPGGVLFSVLLASLSGSLVGLALVALGRGTRKMRLPFGVFLSVGAVATSFFGEPAIRAYRSLWS